MTVPVGTVDAPGEYSVESAVGKLIALGVSVTCSGLRYSPQQAVLCSRQQPRRRRMRRRCHGLLSTRFRL